MSSCCDCSPTYTWLFGSDELQMTLRRTSTPVPDGKNRSSESFSSTTDEMLYHSWMGGLVHGSIHRGTRRSYEGDSLDRLWNESTLTTLNTGSGLHPADIAEAAAATSAKFANVLAPILPAGGPGFENFDVHEVVPAEYAVGPGAGVFGSEVIAADHANCPPPGMTLVPGFLPIGVNAVPVPCHASTGVNFPAIPALATIVPVPVGANYAIAPGSVNFAVLAPVPIGVIVTNGPAPVPAGANLVVGSVPAAVNLAAHYDPYPRVPGNFGPHQVLIQPFPTPSCNASLYCNFFLGCDPNGTCCSQPKTPFNGYA